MIQTIGEAKFGKREKQFALPASSSSFVFLFPRPNPYAINPHASGIQMLIEGPKRY
jgi:hypothetical protein